MAAPQELEDLNKLIKKLINAPIPRSTNDLENRVLQNFSKIRQNIINKLSVMIRNKQIDQKEFSSIEESLSNYTGTLKANTTPVRFDGSRASVGAPLFTDRKYNEFKKLIKEVIIFVNRANSPSELHTVQTVEDTKRTEFTGGRKVNPQSLPPVEGRVMHTAIIEEGKRQEFHTGGGDNPQSLPPLEPGAQPVVRTGRRVFTATVEEDEIKQHSTGEPRKPGK